MPLSMANNRLQSVNRSKNVRFIIFFLICLQSRRTRFITPIVGKSQWTRFSLSFCFYLFCEPEITVKCYKWHKQIIYLLFISYYLRYRPDSILNLTRSVFHFNIHPSPRDWKNLIIIIKSCWRNNPISIIILFFSSHRIPIWILFANSNRNIKLLFNTKQQHKLCYTTKGPGCQRQTNSNIFSIFRFSQSILFMTWSSIEISICISLKWIQRITLHRMKALFFSFFFIVNIFDNVTHPINMSDVWQNWARVKTETINPQLYANARYPLLSPFFLSPF